MTRSLHDARRWAQQGTKLVAGALAGLSDDDLAGPSGLPGWTRKHVLAHLAANAEALGNLVRWATTGRRTPMYASPAQRDADIEAGSRKPGGELAHWYERSAAALETAMDGLPVARWRTEVVTAQGRTVPATEIPWMRAREVLVHAVDIDAGVAFEDLPGGFLTALCDDIAGKRSGGAGPALTVVATDTGSRWTVAGLGDPAHVAGKLAAVTSYLSGRGADDVTATDGRDVPTLPAWL